ncbi:MAG: hypothetical protein AB4042_17655 [Leptolyngbyaceae cyanobacterium]
MVNEHSNSPESQTSDSASPEEMASPAPELNAPIPSEAEAATESLTDQPEGSEPDTDPRSSDSETEDIFQTDDPIAQPTSAVAESDVTTDVTDSGAIEPSNVDASSMVDSTDAIVDVISEDVAEVASAQETTVETLETGVPSSAEAEAEAEPDTGEPDTGEPDTGELDANIGAATVEDTDDDDWVDDSISSTTEAPPPPTSPEVGSTGGKVKTIAAITLTTVIQGANAATASLESIQRSTSAGWEVIQSVLIAIGLTSIQVAKSASNWVLEKVDGESYAAVSDGNAPFLRDRIQTTPIGAKAISLLDRGWDVWTRGLTVFRRILPNSLKNWPNPALTVGLIVIATLLLRLTAAIAPSGAAVDPTSPAPTITAVPSSQPLLLGQDLENSPKDQKLATTLEKRFAKALSQQEEAEQHADVVHGIVINRERERLILILEQSWYDFTQPEQQELASLLAGTAQDNDFDRLTLVNLAGVRVGRSPVIGTDMILYQTTRPIIEIPVVEIPPEDLPIEEVSPDGSPVDMAETEVDIIADPVDLTGPAEFTNNADNMMSDSFPTEDVLEESLEELSEADRLNVEASDAETSDMPELD